jgi:hypothetical protein
MIFPASYLPLPKSEMKIALKLAWMTYKEDKERNFILQAYSHLAQFRDDVGSPIDPRLATGPDNTPARTLEALGPYLAVFDKVTTETNALCIEFEGFIREQAGRTH